MAVLLFYKNWKRLIKTRENGFSDFSVKVIFGVVTKYVFYYVLRCFVIVIDLFNFDVIKQCGRFESSIS